jgi:hypothetical protein
MNCTTYVLLVCELYLCGRRHFLELLRPELWFLYKKTASLIRPHSLTVDILTSSVTEVRTSRFV